MTNILATEHNSLNENYFLLGPHTSKLKKESIIYTYTVASKTKGQNFKT